MNIGERIKDLRLKKGMKQSDLALKANVSRVAIGNYERGDRQPNFEILSKIANALDIEVGELLVDKLADAINKAVRETNTQVASLPLEQRISDWIDILTEEEILNLAAKVVGHKEILSEEEINILKKAIKIALEK